jgi:hypothetical protein
VRDDQPLALGDRVALVENNVQVDRARAEAAPARAPPERGLGRLERREERERREGRLDERGGVEEGRLVEDVRGRALVEARETRRADAGVGERGERRAQVGDAVALRRERQR